MESPQIMNSEDGIKEYTLHYYFLPALRDRKSFMTCRILTTTNRAEIDVVYKSIRRNLKKRSPRERHNHMYICNVRPL